MIATIHMRVWSKQPCPGLSIDEFLEFFKTCFNWKLLRILISILAERHVALRFFNSLAGSKLMGISVAEQKKRLQQVIKTLEE